MSTTAPRRPSGGRGPTRRRRRPASRERSQRTMVLIGVAATAVAAGFMWIGYDAPNTIPGRSYYTLTAQFDDADNTTAHYQVRMGGRNVGQVLRPRVKDGRALIDLQLDADVKPLLSDTRVRIRPRSPVGVRFVELTPGQHGRPLPDGALIPAAQTSSTVTLDTVLDTLDARRRRAARTVLRELGDGFAGRGEELNDTLAATPAFLRDTARALAPLNGRAGATRGFVSGSGAAASAADPVRDDIAAGLKPEADVLGTLAGRRGAIQDTLTAAPPAFDGVRAGLRATTPMLDALAELGDAAARTLPPAPRTFTAVSRLLATARPGLRAAPRALHLASDATTPTLRLLSTLDPVIPTIRSGLDTPAPLLDELGRRDCDVRRWFRNWSGALRYGVDSGHRIGPATSLRLTLLQTAETVGSQGPGTKAVLPPVTTDTYPPSCSGGSR